MKSAFALIALPVLVLCSVSAMADETAKTADQKATSVKEKPAKQPKGCGQGDSCHPGFELIALTGGSFGRPKVFQGVWAVARLRYLNRIPLALEAGFVYPHSLSLVLMTDILRAECWRIHLPNFGILYHIGSDPKTVIRPDVKRRWDLILGAGGEWEFRKNWFLSLDLRFYLPDPTDIPFRYGGFSLPIYRDAAKGVQIWIGIGGRIF